MDANFKFKLGDWVWNAHEDRFCVITGIGHSSDMGNFYVCDDDVYITDEDDLRLVNQDDLVDMFYDRLDDLERLEILNAKRVDNVLYIEGRMRLDD